MKARKFSKISWFKKIDIFGNLFNFTINKQSKFKTNLGSIFSIITLFVILLACIFFGTDFYNRKNPKVLSQKTVPENYTKINITNKILTISWRIEDSNGIELDFSEILFPAIVYNSMNLNPETKNLEFIDPPRNLPYKRCNETINEPNFYKVKNPEEWFCIDFDVRSLQWGGNWDGQFVNYFMLTLNVCKHNDQNERINESCVEFKKLKEFLFQRVFFSINLPSVYFDFTDYENPLKIEYKNFYSHLTRNLHLSDFCNFNNPLLKDDRGWIFTDNQEETNISFDNCDRNYYIKFDEDYLDPTSDDIFYGIDLYLGKSYPYYIRSFMKFQDLVAIVGGFVKLITLIFGFVNLYFNTYERDKFIINYFFNSFKNNNNEEQNKDNLNNKKFFPMLNAKSISNSNNFKFSNDFQDIRNSIDTNRKYLNIKNQKHGGNYNNNETIRKTQENNTLKNLEKNSQFKRQTSNSNLDSRNPIKNKNFINDTMQLTVYSKNYHVEKENKLNEESIRNDFGNENKKNFEENHINDTKSHILFYKKENFSHNDSNGYALKKISSEKLEGQLFYNFNKKFVNNQNKNANNIEEIHNTVVNNKKDKDRNDELLMNIKFKEGNLS